MITFLLKLVTATSLKMFSAMATQQMVEYLLIKVAKMAVDHTKTPHDNEFLDEFLEIYKGDKKKKKTAVATKGKKK